VFSSEAGLNVSATQQLHRIIMEQKNEINDLKTRLARLETIINSSLTVDGNTSNGIA
jgi:divalent metal cation (Fe/Co/Zn/Cd) transporter